MAAQAKIPDNLNYAVIGAMIVLGVAALISLVGQNMLGLILSGGLVAAIYWLGYRNLAADRATAKMTLLMCAGICGIFVVIDVANRDVINFIFAAAAAGALGFAFVQLQQMEQPSGQPMAPPPPAQPAAPSDDRAAKLRMLEDLHRSGVLTAEELAQKKRELGAS